MTWLLRLFPSFRDLENSLDNMSHEVEKLAQQNATLQGQLDTALTHGNELVALVNACLDQERAAYANERASYQMHVNHAMQRQGAGIPYPEAHSLPAHATPKPENAGPVGRMGRVLPSQIVAQATQQWKQSIVARKQAG